MCLRYIAFVPVLDSTCPYSHYGRLPQYWNRCGPAGCLAWSPNCSAPCRFSGARGLTRPISISIRCVHPVLGLLTVPPAVMSYLLHSLLLMLYRLRFREMRPSRCLQVSFVGQRRTVAASSSLWSSPAAILPMLGTYADTIFRQHSLPFRMNWWLWVACHSCGFST